MDSESNNSNTNSKNELEAAQKETDEALAQEVEAAAAVHEEREEIAEEAAEAIEEDVEESVEEAEEAEEEAAEEIRDTIDNAAEKAAEEAGEPENVDFFKTLIVDTLIERGVIPVEDPAPEVVHTETTVVEQSSEPVSEPAVEAETEVEPQPGHWYYKERKYNGLFKKVFGK